jgi:hypothetical protein
MSVAASPLQLEMMLRADIADQLDESEPVTSSVAYNGAGVWFASAGDHHTRSVYGSSTVLESCGAETPDDRYDASVLIQEANEVRIVSLHAVEGVAPLVQLLPDDEILLVAPRCRFAADDSVEPNAFVFDFDGHERRRFVLGDGIQDIEVSASGNIWVSYFDEGVLGRVPWGGFDGSDPPAWSGFLSTDADGRILWRYRPPPGLAQVDDCYAINVAEDATWAYYYSDFPLVRVGNDGKVSTWQTGVSGARAFAISPRHVLFSDAYWKRRSDGVLCEFGERDLEAHRNISLLRPGGAPLERPDVVVGRGPILHAFDGPRWYQLDVRELLD